jgi:hypothetical protein
MSWVNYSGYYIVAHAVMREAIQTRFMPSPSDAREVYVVVVKLDLAYT